jgi:PAS domain S-box-containing protein
MNKADQGVPTRAQVPNKDNHLQTSQYEAVLDVFQDGFWRVDMQGRLLEVNDAYCRMSGYSRSELMNMSVSQMEALESPEQVAAHIRELVAAGGHDRFDSCLRRKDGSIFEVDITVLYLEWDGGQIAVFVRDISERMAKEKELEHLNRTLKALGDINQAMLRSTDEADYLDEVCRIVVEDCGHVMVWIGLAEQDEAKTVRPVAYAGFEEGYIEKLKITWADSERGRGPTGTAVRTGQVSMCRNMLTNPQFEPWRKDALERGYASSIVLPLKMDEKVFGAITIYSREPDPFIKNEVDLLTELANDLAYGIMTLRTRAAAKQAQENLRQAHGRLALAQQSAGAGIWDWDMATDTLEWSPELYQLFGLDPAKSKATFDLWRLILHPEDREAAEEQINRAVEQHLRLENEYRILTSSGEVRWINALGDTVYDASGQPQLMSGICLDITGRKQAEEALLRSEERFRVAQELSLDAFTILDAIRDEEGVIVDFRWTYVNSQAGKILRHAPGDLVGKRLLDVLPGNKTDSDLFECYVRVVETGQAHDYELPYESEGIQGWFRNMTVKLGDGIAVYFSDITERKNSEEALRQSEERYRSLFNNMTEGFALHEIICDEQGQPVDYRFLDINPAFEQLTGLKREQVVGKNHNQVLPDDNPRWVEEYGAVALTGQPVQFENYSPALERHYEVTSYRPAPKQFAVIFKDVTERKKMERALQVNLTKYTVLFKTFPLGITVSDQDGKILETNEAASRLLGIPEDVQVHRNIDGAEWQIIRPDGTPLSPDEYASVRALKENRRIENQEMGICKSDGQVTWISVCATPLPVEGYGVVVTYGDITERKRMEEELRASQVLAEQRANELSAVFDAMAEAVIVYDADGRVQRTNQAALESLGFDPSSDNLADVLNALSIRSLDGSPLDLELAPSSRALHGQIVTGENYLFRKSNGEDGTIVISSSPLWLGDRIGGAVAVWRDITEQLKAQEIQTWLASFPELNPNPVLELDYSGQIHYLNPATRSLFPDLKAKGTEHPWLAGLGPIIADLRADKNLTVRREVQVGEQYYLQTLHCVSPGEWVRIYAFDINSRKQAEAALRQAHDELEQRVHARTRDLSLANQQLQLERQRFYDVLEMLPAYVVLLTPDYHVSHANREFRQRFGESHGRRCYEYLFQRSEPCEICETYKALKEMHPQEWEWTGPDGRNYAIYDFPFPDVDGSMLILEMGIDITERKQAEQELHIANTYNRGLLEASLDPLVTITPDGKIGDVNTATEQVTGCSRQELIGTDFSDYFSDPRKARTSYRQVFKTGSVRDYELEIRHKDGHVTPVMYNASVYRDEAGQVRGVFAVARDITERKQFEAQLVQAEKHAVVGRMVGSIAHEINNPLQTIKNCLYLIQQDTPQDGPIQEPLEMAVSEATRITDLVGQLRELYRPHAGYEKKPADLLEILEEVHTLLTPHLKDSKVRWKPLTGLQSCTINCVRDQILEVFLNISMNAIEAMQHTGGVLSVDMTLCANQVGVVFKDTGTGVPPEILPRLFEPFMTTKNSGLGLGLSISYGIVQQHGGRIVAENCTDGGAAFTVWLPVAKSKRKEKAKHAH